MRGKIFLLVTLLAVGVISDSSSNEEFEDYQPSDSDLSNEESQKEEVTERDREPLSPDYKDPRSREKPILPSRPQKPSYDSSLVPDGVIEVPASGFPFLVSDPLRKTYHDPHRELFNFGNDDFNLPTWRAKPQFFYHDFGSFFDFPKPWWKGPNVCVERQEETDGEDRSDDDGASSNHDLLGFQHFFSASIRFSNCRETPNKYECISKSTDRDGTKKITIRYKCCYGYVRSGDESAGCDKQIDLKPIPDVLTEIGAGEYRKLVGSKGLEDSFREDNMTVFAPSNEALEHYNEQLNQFNDLTPLPQRVRKDMKNLMASDELVWNHVTDGFVDLADLENEQIIFNENKNNTIRINVYPQYNTVARLYTANCKRLTKINQQASNGIVHLVDGVITPTRESIQEIIRNDKRLSNLAQALDATDLFKKFKAEGHYTVFAPTNDAFSKLSASVREKLIKGENCAKSVISHHVTSHTICSEAIVGDSTTHNVDGKILNMKRKSKDDLIFEEEAKIIETDIVASNGVIHLVDTVIIPQSAKLINDVLKDDFSKFEELIEKAGLTEEIDSLHNVTVFAPSNTAFEREETKDILKDIGEDKEKLKEFIKYHIVDGKQDFQTLNEDYQLPTLSNDKTLRINMYPSLVGIFGFRISANCVRLRDAHKPEKTCGSVIQTIDKVLKPPTETVLEFLKKNDNFSKLVELIEGTEIEDILNDGNRSITLLAVPNEAFENLREQHSKILKDKGETLKLLKSHLMREPVCCSGIGSAFFGLNGIITTMSNRNLFVGKTGRDIQIGASEVIKCDQMATNGIVHTVNKLLFSDEIVPFNFATYFDF